jgi:putative ABC transport system substrate-binding protein
MVAPIFCLVAEAGDRLATLGELWYLDAAGATPYREAFRSGLREHGYVDGRDVNIVTVYADGDAARVPALASKLVAMNVDVMFVSPRAVDIARRATATIPIVCVGFGDPVAEGLVSSLARPGGNVTGISSASIEASPKRVELAIEAIPRLRRLALLFDVTHSGAPEEAEAVRDTAHRAGLKHDTLPNL